MSGGSSPSTTNAAVVNSPIVQPTASLTPAEKAAALSSEQMAKMAADRMATAQQAQYLLSSKPTPNYYTPPATQQAYMPSPTLRLPGFQGVPNPFAAHQQAGVAPQQRADQVSKLLGDYNAYKQNYADMLYASQQANQSQLAAAQKAYQDERAAQKARAEAAAAKAEADRLAQERQNSSFFNTTQNAQPSGGANGGIADLYKGVQ